MSVSPAQDWEQAPPEAQGVDPEWVRRASRELSGPGSNALATALVRRGKLVWEQYDHGARPEDAWRVFSVTKSVLSMLVGLAVQAGALRGAGQPLAELFPERRAAPVVEGLTLEHLLRMQTGWLWRTQGHGNEPLMDRLWRSPDWTEFILALPVNRGRVGVFQYCSAASHLLAVATARALGEPLDEFAQRVLFDPLGIAAPTWERDPQGYRTGGWGLYFSARDLARLGWMATQGGVWQGRQVVPADWLAESTRLADGETHGYGYQWWLSRVNGTRVFAAIGIGGQYVFCAPEKELTWVCQSRRVAHWPDRWKLLPALLEACD